LQVGWDGGKGRVGLAVDDELWSGAVAEFADVGYEVAAGFDDGGGSEGGVDYADIGRVFWTGSG
jgi:hypothetical protein